MDTVWFIVKHWSCLTIHCILSTIPHHIHTNSDLSISSTYSAAQYGKADIALHLLDYTGVDVCSTNERGASALLYACLEGQTEVVSRIIEVNPGVLTSADFSAPAVLYNPGTYR